MPLPKQPVPRSGASAPSLFAPRPFATPDMFGADVARELQRTGHLVTGVGNDAISSAGRQASNDQRDREVALLMEKKAEMRNRLQEFAHEDVAPELVDEGMPAAPMNRTGRDAVGIQDEIEDGFESIWDSVSSEVDDPDVLQLLRADYLGQLDSQRIKARDHELVQKEVWLKESAAANVEAQKRSVSKSPWDDRVPEWRAELAASVTIANRKLPPQAIANAIATEMSDFVEGQIIGAASKNAAAALEMFNDLEGDMMPKTRESVKRVVDGYYVSQESRRLADEQFIGARSDDRGLGDMLKSIRDSDATADVKTAAEKRVEHRWRVQEEIDRKEQFAADKGAWDNAVADPLAFDAQPDPGDPSISADAKVGIERYIKAQGAGGVKTDWARYHHINEMYMFQEDDFIGLPLHNERGRIESALLEELHDKQQAMRGGNVEASKAARQYLKITQVEEDQLNLLMLDRGSPIAFKDMDEEQRGFYRRERVALQDEKLRLIGLPEYPGFGSEEEIYQHFEKRRSLVGGDMIGKVQIDALLDNAAIGIPMESKGKTYVARSIGDIPPEIGVAIQRSLAAKGIKSRGRAGKQNVLDVYNQFLAEEFNTREHLKRAGERELREFEFRKKMSKRPLSAFGVGNEEIGELTAEAFDRTLR